MLWGYKMKKEMGKAMRQLRKANKMTQDDLAEKIGVATANISRYENGSQGIEVDKLPVLAKALDVTIPEFFALATGEELDNIEQGPELTSRVPLISWVQAGNLEEVFSDIHNVEDIKWIDTTYKARKFTYALRVVGNSMEPQFPEGCTIIVEPEEIPHNKSFIIAMLAESNRATFKQLIDDESGKFLKPLNKEYPMIPVDGNFSVCGVVKKMQMDV